jgi:hypothetical protein
MIASRTNAADILPKSLLPDVFPLGAAVYEAIVEDFVNHMSDDRGVLWIGKFGSLGTPGISDIDLLVVCREDAYPAVRRRTMQFARQSPIHRYAFLHDIVVVPQAALRYLIYFHELGHLQTLRGEPSMLDRFENPDENILLLRGLLFNSSLWGELLSMCQQDRLGLRQALIFSKGAATSAINNYQRMGNVRRAESIARHDKRQRQQILRAPPRQQCESGQAHLGQTMQALRQADWDLNDWLVAEGLAGYPATEMTVQLSRRQMLVFASLPGARQAALHQHIGDGHVTYLPPFYATLGHVAFQPFLPLVPRLSRIWRLSAQEQPQTPAMLAAGRAWTEAVRSTFREWERAGGEPWEVIPSPFYVREQGPTVFQHLRHYAGAMLPARVRKSLRQRLTR